MKSKPACTYSLLSETKQTNLYKNLKIHHFKNNKQNSFDHIKETPHFFIIPIFKK